MAGKNRPRPGKRRATSRTTDQHSDTDAAWSDHERRDTKDEQDMPTTYNRDVYPYDPGSSNKNASAHNGTDCAQDAPALCRESFIFKESETWPALPRPPAVSTGTDTVGRAVRDSDGHAGYTAPSRPETLHKDWWDINRHRLECRTGSHEPSRKQLKHAFMRMAHSRACSGDVDGSRDSREERNVVLGISRHPGNLYDYARLNAGFRQLFDSGAFSTGNDASTKTHIEHVLDSALLR